MCVYKCILCTLCSNYLFMFISKCSLWNILDIFCKRLPSVLSEKRCLKYMMPLVDIVTCLLGQSRIVGRNTQRGNANKPVNSKGL